MFGTGDARHVGARVEHRLCEANAAANFAEAELDSMRAAFLFLRTKAIAVVSSRNQTCHDF